MPVTIAAVKQLSEALGISRVVAVLLLSRGIGDPKKVQEFLYPTLREHLPDPHQMKNLPQAAELILEFVHRKELITIYCDFDVDGLTSGSQLYLYLTALGAKVATYVPNRFVEGYGLACSAVERLAHAGTSLLVTVDCGITNHREIELAKRLGMKVVVLDHHQPGPTLPPADVVVDPAQEGCSFADHKLAAAGVVWLLLVVLRSSARKFSSNDEETLAAPDPKSFIDLAALGTICDMVPLRGLNRMIAHRGVESIRTDSRLGISALMEVAGVKNTPRFGAGHISFSLGPRINAAGRLEDGGQVITMLTSEKPAESKAIAEKLDRLNRQRQNIESEVKESCIEQLRSAPELMKAPAIAIYGEQYHAGVIGIAAQRLVEQYHRPAAVMAPGEVRIGDEMARVAKGSVRSIEGFHVSDVLQSLDSLLLSHGGHAAAGGFTVLFDKLAAFKEAFVEEARQRLTAEMLHRKVFVDLSIGLDEITFDLAGELARLAPFGVGNPSPVFMSSGVRVDSISVLKQKHLRVRVSDGEVVRNAIAWNMFGNPLLRKNAKVDLAFQVELNTYQGVSSVQLNIKEVWQ